MTDFDPYTEPFVPTKVTQVNFQVRSELVEDVDEFGDPLGTFTETEFIEGYATVVDQFGEITIHNASNYEELISKNVLTAQQLLTIQTWIQNIRDTVEGLLLP